MIDLPWLCGVGLVGYSAMMAAGAGFGWDARVYWEAARGTLYTTGPGTLGYFYSPAFAQLIRPLAHLPWPLFCALWCGAAAVVFALLLRPLGWRRAVPLWLCCAPEIASGNVFWLFAVVVAFGLRSPWLWAVPALTKITPALGPVWFAVRREWSKLGVAVLATVLVGGLSFVLDPVAWLAWMEFLRTYLGTTTSQVGGLFVPPVVRIPAAVILVAWGALRDRRWTIPVGMVLATPVFGSTALVVLAGLPLLLRDPTPACPPDDPASSAGQAVGDRGGAGPS